MNKEALGSLKGLSRDGERADYSENLHAHPLRKTYLSITFSQIHLL
jgi:hypothetical protein